MERDVNSGRYDLLQNGKQLELKETHFQPIFFANDVEGLRKEPGAQKALKKYRIFVGPDDVVEELKEQAIPVVDIHTSLHAKMAAQRASLQKEYEELQNLKLNTDRKRE